MGVRKTGRSEAAVSNAKTAIAIDRSEPDGFQAALICKSGEFISWTVGFGHFCRSDSMSLRMLRSGCSTCMRMPRNRQRYTFSRFGEAGYLLSTDGAALLCPHPVMQRRCFILQQRPHHLGRPLSALEHLPAWQVERRVFRMVAGDAAQPMLAQAIDQAADAGPVHGARAHRAGFGGRIERRRGEHVPGKGAAGL